MQMLFRNGVMEEGHCTKMSGSHDLGFMFVCDMEMQSVWCRGEDAVSEQKNIIGTKLMTLWGLGCHSTDANKDKTYYAESRGNQALTCNAWVEIAC